MTGQFVKFCSEISLHGWMYLGQSKAGNKQKTFWALVILGCCLLALYFLSSAVRDFQSTNVKVQISDWSKDLTNVHFPSVVVCNLSPLKSSFLSLLSRGLEDEVSDSELWRLVTGQYVFGSVRNLTAGGRQLLNRLLGSRSMEDVFRELAEKSTRPGFVVPSNVPVYLEHSLEARGGLANLSSMRAEDKVALYESYFLELAGQWDEQEVFAYLHWSGMYETVENPLSGVFVQPGFGTDYGICTWITALVYHQGAFAKKDLVNLPFGALNGDSNGLTMILDAETFDYGAGEFSFGEKPGEGFKIAVVHHLDMPLMGQSGVAIQPGTVTQVAVTPSLQVTSERARERFTPAERNCYFTDEVSLEILQKGTDFRFSISNCLFEAAMQQINSSCRCLPGFLPYSDRNCQGEGLWCMREILDDMGSYWSVRSGRGVQKCMSACQDESFSVLVSSASYPSRRSFSYRPDFCYLVKKLAGTCRRPARRRELESVYGRWCGFIGRAAAGGACRGDRWAPSAVFGDKNETLRRRFEASMLRYAKDNLAMVKIYVKDPYVKEVTNDVNMTYITFVSNVGGILGLCLGCSFISGAEILWHVATATRAFVSRRKGLVWFR